MPLSKLTTPGGFHLIFFQPDGSQIRLSIVATNCADLQALAVMALRALEQS